MKLLYNLGKRTMLFLFATLITFPALAQPSKTDDGSIPYATFDAATSTFYFKWGVPEGTVNVDYCLVNYTTEYPQWSSYPDNPSPVLNVKKIQKVVFEPAFANARPTKCAGWFAKFRSLTSIEGLEYLNTSECTTMNYMFGECVNLETVDVSGFNTKKVTNMQQMFSNCAKLLSVTFGKDFSTELVPPINTSMMFANDVRLRFIDLFASDHTDAVNTANIDYFFGSLQNNKTKVVYLPHGKQDITNRTNFVYSYNGDETDLRCPQYYSEDKVDIEFPYNFRTNEAEYKRSTANEKGTVILPYAFTSNENVRAYTLNKEYKDVMWFESTETVAAHTPFVFRNLNGSTTADFTQTDASQNFGITVYATRDTKLHGPYEVSTPLGGWKMKGLYVQEKSTCANRIYYIQGDKFVRANGETLTGLPHRVFFVGQWAENPNAAAPSFNIKFSENNTTAIEGIETEDTAETQAIFDTAGRKLSAPKKGVNIIRLNNGTTKKVIIK